jgi:hypothetical protein
MKVTGLVSFQSFSPFKFKKQGRAVIGEHTGKRNADKKKDFLQWKIVYFNS